MWLKFQFPMRQILKLPALLGTPGNAISKNYSKSGINFSKTSCSMQNEHSINMTKDTICALSSAPGVAGVAVIRVSGDQTTNILKSFTNHYKLPPRTVKLTKIHDPSHKEIIDKGLVVYFPGPASYTGEDLLEFHVHGSIAVVNCLLNHLVNFNGVRFATAGEFSRRAFYNNKMDLAQIEGIGDLLKAETEQQRKQALNQANGFLTKSVRQWQDILISSIASIEAFIEFGDTDNVDFDIESLAGTIKLLKDDLEITLDKSKRAVVLSNGIGIAIYGMPNAGKSSLFNRLVKSNRALVTQIPGTTRDVIEVPLNLGGFRVNLADTAGLRAETDCRIEEIGIRKAVSVLFSENTAMHILVLPADLYSEILRNQPDQIRQIIEYVRTFAVPGILNESAADLKSLFKKPTVIVVNKKDLINPQDAGAFNNLKDKCYFVSCTTNHGITELLAALEKNLKEIFRHCNSGDPQCTTLRQIQCVKNCCKFLDLFTEEVNSSHKHNLDFAIVSQILKRGLDELNYLTGRISNEEILARIFENFCIGK